LLNAKKVYEGQGIKSKMIIDSNVIIDTFDPSSENHRSSKKFMDYIVKYKILFAMPMHGWFEINCSLNKIRDRSEIAPPFLAGQQMMPIEFIHIDDHFLQNYSYVDIPWVRTMDHLFLVVAKKYNLPLITWDKKMKDAGEKCGVNVSNPTEWMQRITKSP
jgi:predicted nucleic acid-binding protein